MKIKLTPEARNDLRAIRRYVAQDNPRAADRVVSRLRQTILTFGRFPFLGKEGRIDGTYEFTVPGLPFTIVYALPSDRELDVLTVLHQNMKYPPSED